MTSWSSRLLPSWPLLVGFAAMLHPLGAPRGVIGDPDTYLHIAAGRWILAHAALPAQDPFSHSMAGASWVVPEWLSELVLAAVFGVAGWSGLELAAALCFGAAMALLTRSLLRHGEPLSTLVLVTAVVLLALPHLLARPHTLALPLLVAWSAGLFAARDSGRGPPLWLLPVMALWANLHGSFMFGLALAGYLGVEAVIWPSPATGRRGEGCRWAAFLLLGLLRRSSRRIPSVASCSPSACSPCPFCSRPSTNGWRPTSRSSRASSCGCWASCSSVSRPASGYRFPACC
jgi:hypothetical protein